MKQLKIFVTFALVAAMMLGTFDAGAKTKRNRTSKSKTQKTTKAKAASSTLSVQDVIDIYSSSFNTLALDCPYEAYNGVMLESVSFKNKCVKMVMSYTDEYMEDYGMFLEGTDFSAVGDPAIRILTVKYIKQMSIPIETFAKTGIYYDFTIKDNKGTVLWHKVISNKEVVKYYNEPASKNSFANNTFTLESLKALIKTANNKTPIDAGYGISVTNISMEGNNIYYDVKVDNEEVVEAMEANPEIFRSIFKESMASSFYDTFGLNSDIFDNMISLGIFFNMRFYKPGKSTPILNVPISAREIKNSNN